MLSDPEFQKAYQEQNRRDQISTSTLATVLSMILNLSCSLMDYFMYPALMPYFFRARLCSIALVALTWAWFRSPIGRKHHRLFGIVWYASPMAMILWMIAVADDPYSVYYAGLNIILLAVGLLSPWTYVQNLISAVLVLAGYLTVCLSANHPQPASFFINNMTFLVLTAVIVVSGSLANSRQRRREFELRWELDKNRRIVEESNEKLKKLDEVKSRLFANISHELRTPLTLLLAPLDTLLKRFKADQPNQELLLTMRSNGMRLLKLINDLLDLVRLESGRMEVKREPVDVSSFIKGLASAARQVAEDKRIRLETNVDADLGILLADRDKLEKIILNLLFNALKFTPLDGRVEVRAEKTDTDFILRVQDTGIGIAEKNLPYIFDRFWQGDTSSTRKHQGTGIGLALVKELVELQGGTVSVQSQESQGTTFSVHLPFLPALENVPPPSQPAADELADTESSGKIQSEEWLANLYRRAELFPAIASAPSAARPAGPAEGGPHRRILIADDEPDMLGYLRSELRGEYQVIEATDGQQAIEKASQFLPDLILLDMMMPEKNGVEACRELRERPLTQNIPIILLTARAEEETKLDALKAGASDFLSKPFSTTELHVRIRNLVESYEYQRRVSKQNQVLERTIDQLKETESQLVESEKMRSLGQLSAGMIHEINNPLNFATTGLYTLRGKAKLLVEDQRAEYVEIVDDVEEGVKRVKDLVLKMREFSYADNTRVEMVELTQVLGSALRFLSHEWKGKVEIHQQVPEGEHIWANKNRMTQVILNLLQNSLDALGRKPFEAEKPTIWIETHGEGDRRTLVIRDNGVGIDPEHLDKIFDPFFTTKDVGQGMGLGLSICYRIVQDYGGRISVRSEPGKSCEFRLDFPARPPVEEVDLEKATTGNEYARSV